MHVAKADKLQAEQPGDMAQLRLEQVTWI